MLKLPLNNIPERKEKPVNMRQVRLPIRNNHTHIPSVIIIQKYSFSK